jgi:hypothetical protein
MHDDLFGAAPHKQAKQKERGYSAYKHQIINANSFRRSRRFNSDRLDPALFEFSLGNSKAEDLGTSEQ